MNIEPREEILKKIRIANIVNALFLANDGEEVHEALKKIPMDNLQCLANLCIHEIKQRGEK